MPVPGRPANHHEPTPPSRIVIAVTAIEPVIVRISAYSPARHLPAKPLRSWSERLHIRLVIVSRGQLPLRVLDRQSVQKCDVRPLNVTLFLGSSSADINRCFAGNRFAPLGVTVIFK